MLTFYLPFRWSGFIIPPQSPTIFCSRLVLDTHTQKNELDCFLWLNNLLPTNPRRDFCTEVTRFIVEVLIIAALFKHIPVEMKCSHMFKNPSLGTYLSWGRICFLQNVFNVWHQQKGQILYTLFKIFNNNNNEKVFFSSVNVCVRILPDFRNNFGRRWKHQLVINWRSEGELINSKHLDRADLVQSLSIKSRVNNGQLETK